MIVPSEPSEEDTVFSCQHNSADIIGWLVNGTALHGYDSVATTCIIPLPHGAPLNNLKIRTDPAYNNTVVICVAIFFDGTPREMTSPVHLTFQGYSS